MRAGQLCIVFRRRLIVAVLCCAVLPSCGWLKDAGVAAFGDEFFEDEEDPRIQALTEFKPKLKIAGVWSSAVGGKAEKSHIKLLPLVQGDVVFASDPRGRVRAFSARDGKRLWSQSFDAPVSFAVGGSGGTLMVGTAVGEIIAFAADDGRRLWRKRFAGDEITAISRNHRGQVLVRDAGGRIIAAAVEDGKRLWKIETELPTLTLRGMSVPRLYEDFGFVGLDDGKLLVIALDDGRIQRQFRVGAVTKGSSLDRIVDIDGRFQIYEDVLYVATYRGRMLALDLKTQRGLWSAEVESYAGLDVDGDLVYTVGTDGEVYALDRFSGARVWSNPAFVVRNLSAPLARGKTVVVGDNLGYLYWLSSEDGSILARRRVARSPITSAPAAWRSHVITLDRGGDLTATKITARLVARSK